MKKTVRLLALAGVACAILIGSGSVSAQDQPPQQGNRNRGPGGPGGQGGQRPSMEDMRKRMSDRLRELMEVKDDAEWQLLEPRIQKVMELNRETRFSSMSVLFSQPGGDNNGGGRSSRFGGGTTPPEVDDLRKAIEGKAGEGDVKVRLERLREARKGKEAAIEQAQEELRKLLTSKQEAVAVLVGLLK